MQTATTVAHQSLAESLIALLVSIVGFLTLAATIVLKLLPYIKKLEGLVGLHGQQIDKVNSGLESTSKMVLTDAPKSIENKDMLKVVFSILSEFIPSEKQPIVQQRISELTTQINESRVQLGDVLRNEVITKQGDKVDPDKDARLHPNIIPS
jgi:hypothetical protein